MHAALYSKSTKFVYPALTDVGGPAGSVTS